MSNADLSRAVGYCRVSTQRQNTQGHGLERYIQRLKEYGLNDNQIHWDIESGASETRKGYNRVLDLIRSGDVDKVVVPCFDRFTRSALGWEKAKDELLKYNVELVFLDGSSFDLETPDGQLTSRILAAFAANVRDKNRYNSKQGHRYFQEKQKTYVAIFGLRKDGDYVVPNENIYGNTNKTYADIAREYIDIFLSVNKLQTSIKIMCQRYGKERARKQPLSDFPRTRSGLRTWLSNPQLCGAVRYFQGTSREYVSANENNKGIISEDTFNKVQRILSLNSVSKTSETNPLAGLVHCHYCGSKMLCHWKKYKGEKYTYWKCSGYYHAANKERICNFSHGVRYEKVYSVVINTLKEAAKKIAENTQIDTQRVISKEFIDLQQEIQKLLALDDPDLIDAINKKKRRLKSMALQQETNIADLNQRKRLLVALSQDAFWEQATTPELTMVFREVISKVVIEGKSNVFVSLNFFDS